MHLRAPRVALTAVRIRFGAALRLLPLRNAIVFLYAVNSRCTILRRLGERALVEQVGHERFRLALFCAGASARAEFQVGRVRRNCGFLHSYRYLAFLVLRSAQNPFVRTQDTGVNVLGCLPLPPLLLSEQVLPKPQIPRANSPQNRANAWNVLLRHRNG